jgi:hypothetical protein
VENGTSLKIEGWKEYPERFTLKKIIYGISDCGKKYIGNKNIKARKSIQK